MPKRSYTVSDQDEQDEMMIRLAGTVGLLRRGMKTSLRELAEKAGVSHSDLFRLENANSRNPSLFLIRKVAKVFGMTVDQLMNFEARECPTCHGAGCRNQKDAEEVHQDPVLKIIEIMYMPLNH